MAFNTIYSIVQPVSITVWKHFQAQPTSRSNDHLEWQIIHGFCLINHCPAQSTRGPRRSMVITIRHLHYSLAWFFLVIWHLSSSMPILKVTCCKHCLAQQDNVDAQNKIFQQHTQKVNPSDSSLSSQSNHHQSLESLLIFKQFSPSQIGWSKWRWWKMFLYNHLHQGENPFLQKPCFQNTIVWKRWSRYEWGTSSRGNL